MSRGLSVSLHLAVERAWKLTSTETWLGEVHRGPRHARFLKALDGTPPVAGCGRWAEKLVYLSGWVKFRFSRRSGEPAPGLSAKAPPHRRVRERRSRQ